MWMNRRGFAVAGLASIAFAGMGRRAAAEAVAPTYRNEVPGYGPLQTDPQGLLDLPAGFSARIVSKAGEAMDDGYVTPDKFDGMACFRLSRHKVALVRNHELRPEDRDMGATGGIARLEARLAKERFFGRAKDGTVLPGGTSTIVYDLRSGRREKQYLSLAGTTVNCAGGATPWGSWLSCEESTLGIDQGSHDHGWVFDVPARHRGLVAARPLTALGRFRHEAAAVDPLTGIVYLTEDRNDGLFYRFVPERQGRLDRGRLQALALRDTPGADTRNWSGIAFEPRSMRQTRWIDLDETHSPGDDLRLRGHAAGAALFARGEGIHRGSGEFYFTCTSGGAARLGQVMRYVPSRHEGRPGEDHEPGGLQLFVESSDPLVMDYADNLTVAPWGHLIACEDRADGEANHLKGITPDGRVYTLGRLRLDTELAGVCFSPDASTLFVNIYRPGHTLAISGDWKGLRSA